MDDNTRMKIAMESAKTQKKMRDQFIKDFMETTNVEDLGEEAAATLEYVLMVAYNKGAADALSISVTSQLAAIEGGGDYDI